RIQSGRGRRGWVTAAAVEIGRPGAHAKGIRLEVFLDGEPVSIMGDVERLQQVVWNLVSNAIKFTPRGGQIQVRLERVDTDVRISVTDTGRGITRDFLPHLFESFRQAETGPSRAYGGLGLGL